VPVHPKLRSALERSCWKADTLDPEEGCDMMMTCAPIGSMKVSGDGAGGIRNLDGHIGVSSCWRVSWLP
jgi:hypothetical protein